ncbi:MAG: protoporphyrinogen oxidase [Ignavibacteria bacterium]|nr:protoporphyrinogen oxidase [Ignavibacteria bacterium]
MMKTRAHVVIVGAGISGLTAAWWLHEKGVDVTVLEKNSWVGGTMRTIREDGWLVETGPNSALETTPLFGEMFSRLKIADERLYANPASNRRYILRNGKLNALPMSPGAFLTTRLWTAGGKLRLLKEPFVGRATEEETIAQFVERRLGKEFLDYAINPFVAGVFAGDPAQLSVRAAFPKLYALEEKYGGLIKGMIRGRRERKERAETAKDRAKMFSFRMGMQTFPLALSSALGDRVRLNAEVERIVIPGSDGGKEDRLFTVRYQKNGGSVSVDADAVIIAAPSAGAANLIRPYDSLLATKLEKIYHPPVAEVFLGYKQGGFDRPLDGFGYLVPAKERRSILGTIWSSALFPDRAPEGHVALATFVGGSRQPEIAGRNDSSLLELVGSEINGIMGGRAEPVYARVIRWTHAIPQYLLGHLGVMREIERFESEVPGLFLCSNYRGGIAVGDCVMNGKAIADRAADSVRSSPPVYQT